MIARLRAVISSPRRSAAVAISSLGAGVADRRVVLARLEPLQQRAVAAREPADPQARQPVRLGHHAERQRGRRQVGRLGQRRGARRAPARGRPRRRTAGSRARRTAPTSAAHVAGSGSAPVGLFGKLTATSRVSGRSSAVERVEVERPAVVPGRARGRTRRRRSRAARSPSTGSSGTVTMAWSPGPDELLHRPEHRLLGAGEARARRSGSTRLVRRGDRRAQRVGAPRSACSRAAARRAPASRRRPSTSATVSVCASEAVRWCRAANSQRPR